MDSIGTGLLFSVVYGSVGFGYSLYGKKQKNLVALLAIGAALTYAPRRVSL